MPLAALGLSNLTADECLALLGANTFGRVVLSVNAMPAALPVNFRVVGGDIVFRSTAGSKLAAALDHTVVAFEIDDHDTARRSGWSVLVVGTARHVTEPVELRRIQSVGIDSWLLDPPPNFVAIAMDRISGRRVGPAPLPDAAGPPA